jgi:hypothetical protein
MVASTLSCEPFFSLREARTRLALGEQRRRCSLGLASVKTGPPKAGEFADGLDVTVTRSRPPGTSYS